MSKLNLQPEYETIDTSHGTADVPASAADGTLAADQSGDGTKRAMRRRRDAARLSFPSDDGFRLFRIY